MPNPLQHIDEEFVTISALPGYAISNYGYVLNTDRDRVLTPRDAEGGSLRVALYALNRRHEVYLHRLVAKAFLKDYEEGVRVDFYDGDRTNCAAYNLFMSDARCRKAEMLW